MSAGAAMTAASLQYLRAHPGPLSAMRANATALKQGLRSLGLAIDDHDSPVATFVTGDAERMRRIQAALYEQGIFIMYSTYVGAGPQGALRCAAFADHAPRDIRRLMSALESLL